jgi:hypothetical protein
MLQIITDLFMFCHLKIMVIMQIIIDIFIHCHLKLMVMMRSAK